YYSMLVLIAATVAAHIVGCKKEKQSVAAKQRESLDVGVSDLDDVQPVKREVSRANEIRGGARGKKAEYKTLAQMQTSDFEKSMGVQSEPASIAS
ncbi:hypothetical protein PMAYCL1PPCAC_22003, partial [Pristionchus mayeri]